MGGNSGRLDLEKEEPSPEYYTPRRESLLKRESIRHLENLENLAALTEDLDAVLERDDDSNDVDGEEETEDNEISKFVGVTSSSENENALERRSSISYKNVVINEFAYTTGDNPCVSSGPPVSMEWDSHHTESINLDEYEELRKGDRRLVHMLKMPKDVRIDKLAKAGLSQGDINQCTRSADKRRMEILRTSQDLYLAKREEKNERIRKWLKNLFTNYKKKEREYIENALSYG